MSSDHPAKRSLFDDIVETIGISQYQAEHQVQPVTEPIQHKTSAKTDDEEKAIELLRVRWEAAGEYIWPYIVSCLLGETQDSLGGNRHYIPKKPKTVRDEQVWLEMDLGLTCAESGLRHGLSAPMIHKIRSMRPTDER